MSEELILDLLSAGVGIFLILGLALFLIGTYLWNRSLRK